VSQRTIWCPHQRLRLVRGRLLEEDPTRLGPVESLGETELSLEELSGEEGGVVLPLPISEPPKIPSPTTSDPLLSSDPGAVRVRELDFVRHRDIRKDERHSVLSGGALREAQSAVQGRRIGPSSLGAPRTITLTTSCRPRGITISEGATSSSGVHQRQRPCTSRSNSV
jgi:hypothetical protein